MCGIFGFVGSFDPIQRRMLAYLNSERGTDGTGFVWRDGKEWGGMKRGTDIREFFWSEKKTGEIDKLFTSKVILGHTRRRSTATWIGGKEDKFAHPFEFQRWVVAHNGYIQNCDALGREYGPSKVDVDSQVLPHILEKDGLDGLKKVVGKAGLWIVNKEDQDSIWLWCWDQDLSIAQNKDGIVFSSDSDHLVSIGIKEDDIDILDGKKGELLQLSVKEKKIISNTKIKGKTYETVIFNGTDYGYGNNFRSAAASVGRMVGLTKKAALDSSHVMRAMERCADRDGQVSKILQQIYTGNMFFCKKCGEAVAWGDRSIGAVSVSRHSKFADCGPNECGGEMFTPSVDEIIGALVQASLSEGNGINCIGWLRGLEMSGINIPFSSSEFEKEYYDEERINNGLPPLHADDPVKPSLALLLKREPKMEWAKGDRSYIAPTPSGEPGKKKIDCVACEGKGRSSVGTECPICLGMGFIMKWMCPKCLGWGEHEEMEGSNMITKRCVRCNGIGWLDHRPVEVSK